MVWATTAFHDRRQLNSGIKRSGFNDRQHADLIDTMPVCYAQAPWIEIEAKSKEEAIDGLRPWLAAISKTACIDD
jgi:UV DNA damage endonuclease